MKYVYVGRTTNFKNRKYQHLNTWCHNSKIADWILEIKNKDKGIIWEILEFCKKEDLPLRERYWIKKFLENNDLLNLQRLY